MRQMTSIPWAATPMQACPAALALCLPVGRCQLLHGHRRARLQTVHPCPSETPPCAGAPSRPCQRQLAPQLSPYCHPQKDGDHFSGQGGGRIRDFKGGTGSYGNILLVCTVTFAIGSCHVYILILKMLVWEKSPLWSIN